MRARACETDSQGSLLNRQADGSSRFFNDAGLFAYHFRHMLLMCRKKARRTFCSYGSPVKAPA